MREKLSAGILLIAAIIIFCGFKRAEKPFIILSSGDIDPNNTTRIERIFTSKGRINYALVCPDGLKYAGVRLQIASRNEKTSNWGFSIIKTRDMYLDISRKYHKDYIYIEKPGNYFIQFFYLNKKNYPFAHKEFIVK